MGAGIGGEGVKPELFHFFHAEDRSGGWVPEKWKSLGLTPSEIPPNCEKKRLLRASLPMTPLRDGGRGLQNDYKMLIKNELKFIKNEE